MRRVALALMVVAVAVLPGQGCFFALCLTHAGAAAQYEELPRRGHLGVRLAPLSDEVRARQQLERGSGVLIEAVIPGTTAADDGIKQGDVLLAVNGKSVGGIGEVMTVIASMTVSLKIDVGRSRRVQLLDHPPT